MGQAHDEVDRAVWWVHLVVLAIPAVLVVVVWTTQGADELFQRIVLPSVLVVHGVLLIGMLTGRLRLGTVGPFVVASPALIAVARLVTWETVPASRPDDFGLVVAALAWFGLLFALAFLVFGTRRGARVSLAAYVVIYSGAVWSSTSGMVADSGSIGVVVFLATGHAALIIVVWVLARNVEKLATSRARAELLELQATTDPLTGVANRRQLDNELQRFVAHARRHGQPLSVVLVDLDRFKKINDTLGHDVGDRVLRATVNRMSAVVREGEVLGRWGGEEFLVLAPQTSHAAARALAERCRRAIAASAHEEGEVAVTASFGVATLEPGGDARTLMRRADLALYAAKTEGRDRVVSAGPSRTAMSSLPEGHQ